MEWVVIKTILEEKGFFNHKISGYNEMITNKISECIEQYSNVEIENDNDGKIYRFGFSNTHITLPKDSEENRNITSIECIHGNMSMMSPVYTDFTFSCDNVPPTTYPKIKIGSIPTMKYSILDPMTERKGDKIYLASNGECFYDQGGYYIINGLKYILSPQENSRYNRVVVYSGRKKQPRYEYYSEIRSSNPMGTHSTAIIFGYMNEKFSCMLPWIDKTPIPLSLIFRAFGIFSEEDIMRIIMGNDWQNDKDAINLLSLSLESEFTDDSDEDKMNKALLFIGKNGRKYSLFSGKKENEKSKTDKSKLEKETISYALHLIENEVLPHIGKNNELKIYTIGYGFSKLIEVILKRRRIDDRDHYKNKLISVDGALLLQQFNGAMKKMVAEISKKIVKSLGQKNNICAMSLIKEKIITSAMHGAVMNDQWISKGPTSRGIKQQYDEYCYLARLANNRKLSVNMNKDAAKITHPRTLHGSHYNGVCPAETPEGKDVGLKKALSVLTMISVGCNPNIVYEILVQIGVIPFEKLKNKLAYTKIFVNGIWFGGTKTPRKVVSQLRLRRRRGDILFEVSICHNEKDDEINIGTEAGRILSPYFIVTKGRVNIEKIKCITPSFNNFVYSGVVEYIDKEEQEEITLSSYLNDVTTDHTHCEIHPSIIYGVGASYVPFPNFNPSPRNSYQCLWKNEPVLMADGTWKKIKNISVGEEVYTFNPSSLKLETTKVIAQLVRPTDKKIYRIKTDSGRKIVATFDHKFIVYDNEKPRWCKVEDMTVGKTFVGICDFEYDKPTKIIFVPITSICEVENCTIADITTESNNHSFIAGDGFCVHNSAMGKQGMGVPFTNFRQVMSGKFHVLNYPQRPLCLSKIGEILKLDKLSSGQVAMVAILPFIFNQEDGIEMNSSSTDRGFMNSTMVLNFYADNASRQIDSSMYSVSFEIPKKEECETVYTQTQHLDSNGIVKVGSKVKMKDVLIGMTMLMDSNAQKPKKDISLRYDSEHPGVVHKIKTGINGQGYKYIRIMITVTRIPKEGDKFSARHGQKGTIGQKYRQEDMPFCMRTGETPDILVNALAFAGRMTIGMLIEILTGKKLLETSDIDQMYFWQFYEKVTGDKKTFQDVKSEMFENKVMYDATPFNKEFSLDEIRNYLSSKGLNEFGSELMVNGMTGEIFNALIFYGPCFYQRLKHLVDEKKHCRTRGTRSSMTRQPVGGIKQKGGLRIGVMERDVLVGQGVSAVLKDRLFEQSDQYTYWICDVCGLQAFVDKERKRRYCGLCYGNKISRIRIPFGTKLILQELQAMGIVCRILTSPYEEKQEIIPIDKNQLEKLKKQDQ